MKKVGLIVGIILIITLIIMFQLNLFSTNKTVLDEEIEGDFTIEKINLENFPSRNTTQVSLTAIIENQEMIENLNESFSETNVTRSDEDHIPLRYIVSLSTDQGETYILQVDHQYIQSKNQLYKVKGENKLYTALEENERIDWKVWVDHKPLSELN